MVSRANLSGRPRPSGVLKTVQDGGGLVNDDLAVAAGDVGGVTGPRRRRPIRREQDGTRTVGGSYIGPDPDAPPVGIDDPNPPPIEPPPVQHVPPSPPHGDILMPGGSRTGGGAGYRARTANVAREQTEEQQRTARGSRFMRPPRTAPQNEMSSVYGRRYGGGGQAPPRWESSQGGGGYGTIPEALPAAPPPEPPPAEPPPTRPPREDRDRRRGRRGRGGPGPKQRR